MKDTYTKEIIVERKDIEDLLAVEEANVLNAIARRDEVLEELKAFE